MNAMDLRMERPITSRWPALLAGATIAMTGLGGCVTINAPEKPIVINLNISITQEVVYRLDAKAKSVIQEQPGIF